MKNVSPSSLQPNSGKKSFGDDLNHLQGGPRMQL